MPAKKLRIEPSETEFTNLVLELAAFKGWMTLHIRPGRTADSWRTPVQGDGVGFPDIFAVRPPRLVAAELKVGYNKVTPAQQAWLATLAAAGVETFVWYPKDWDEIKGILS